MEYLETINELRREIFYCVFLSFCSQQYAVICLAKLTDSP